MEILDLALSLELDLKDFYEKMAELNKENSLNVVFAMLSKEEDKHATILKNQSDQFSLPLEDSNMLSKIESIFKDMDDFKSEIKDIPNQLDSYRMALEKEQQSLKFYQDLHASATKEQSKTIFEYLIKQEDRHCVILEELVKLVTRPEEWIESAEFGARENY